MASWESWKWSAVISGSSQWLSLTLMWCQWQSLNNRPSLLPLSSLFPPVPIHHLKLPGRVSPWLLCIRRTWMFTPRRSSMETPRVSSPWGAGVLVVSVQRCGAPFVNTPTRLVGWTPKQFCLNPELHRIFLECIFQFLLWPSSQRSLSQYREPWGKANTALPLSTFFSWPIS